MDRRPARVISTIVTSIAALGLGFGRDAMDRVANHRTAKVTDVYDRHGHADEDQLRACSSRSSKGAGPATWSA